MGQRAVLLPAAGASSRMKGRDKLLEDVDGAPCLRAMARRALDSAERVIVTLPDANHSRAKALEGLPVEQLVIPDHAEGMSASLRAGAKAAGTETALMVLPPDMPALEARDLNEMWEAFEALPAPTILRAKAENGAVGHPVLFSSCFLWRFETLTGDEGAAPILRANSEALRFHPLQGTRATLDLDTVEAWEQWRLSSTQGK